MIQCEVCNSWANYPYEHETGCIHWAPKDGEENNSSLEGVNETSEESTTEESENETSSSGGSDDPSSSKKSSPEAGGDSSLKEKITENVLNNAPGGETVQKVQETASRVQKTAESIRSTTERVAWAAKGFIAVITNPFFWIALAASIVVVFLAISGTTTYQTVGQMKTEKKGGGVANEQIARLIQRATLLQSEANAGGSSFDFGNKYPDGYRTFGVDNPWASACPDITGYIYGIPETYSTGNGNENARKQFDRMKAAGLEPRAWAFPDTKSPGAQINQPPAGAITEAVGGGGYGHTYVVLTDEGHVIDNTWRIPGHESDTQKAPKTLDERGDRGDLTGWVLPPEEGYEGTYMDDFPNLPDLPAWAVELGISSDGGGDSNSKGSGKTELLGGAPPLTGQREGWLKSAGIKEADWKYVNFIAFKESSWNPKAVNPNGGASGLIQALPCSKVPGNCLDPVDNLKWANGYAKNRYGGWKGAYAFWTANNWW